MCPAAPFLRFRNLILNFLHPTVPRLPHANNQHARYTELLLSILYKKGSPRDFFAADLQRMLLKFQASRLWSAFIWYRLELQRQRQSGLLIGGSLQCSILAIMQCCAKSTHLMEGLASCKLLQITNQARQHMLTGNLFWQY